MATGSVSVGDPASFGLADDDGLVVGDGDGYVAVADEDDGDVERWVDGLEEGFAVGGLDFGFDGEWWCDG